MGPKRRQKSQRQPLLLPLVLVPQEHQVMWSQNICRGPSSEVTPVQVLYSPLLGLFRVTLIDSKEFPSIALGFYFSPQLPPPSSNFFPSTLFFNLTPTWSFLFSFPPVHNLPFDSHPSSNHPSFTYVLLCMYRYECSLMYIKARNWCCKSSSISHCSFEWSVPHWTWSSLIQLEGLAG